MGWYVASCHGKKFSCDEPKRNGKVPKILTRRFFPPAQYSIRIDGKMERIVDPFLIQGILWRGSNSISSINITEIYTRRLMSTNVESDMHGVLLISKSEYIDVIYCPYYSLYLLI